ncbi:MAG: hypothetical protein JXD18_13180 [Anaerolineae bacterium]|nr:hypothetical protein [Anaerolineae bacterium]
MTKESDAVDTDLCVGLTLSDAARAVSRLHALPDRPTAVDVPGLSRVAAWPLVGSALALAREFYTRLWDLTHRGRPWVQQTRFNAAADEAIRQLTWHVETLETIVAEQERTLADLNRRVFLMEQRAGERQLDL